MFITNKENACNGDSVCDNCGADDFREDWAHGDICCYNCGLVADRLYSDQVRYKESRKAQIVDQGVSVQSYLGDKKRRKVCLPKSLPYKRSTYFKEVISQWRMREPAIPTHDLDDIYQLHKRRGKHYVIGKQQVRDLLKHLDDELRQLGQDPYYVRLYLEKWRTIRYYCTRIASTGARIADYEVYDLTRMFSQIEGPFNRLVASVDKKRQSFLNYNFVLRRLNDLRGRTHLNSDLPPLKTPAKQKALVRIWMAICQDLKWPYVNTDCDMFPTIVKRANFSVGGVKL